MDENQQQTNVLNFQVSGNELTAICKKAMKLVIMNILSFIVSVYDRASLGTLSSKALDSAFMQNLIPTFFFSVSKNDADISLSDAQCLQ